MTRHYKYFTEVVRADIGSVISTYTPMNVGDTYDNSVLLSKDYSIGEARLTWAYFLGHRPTVVICR